MRDLTPKAKEFLVQYYMEPAKTWLALAIEQVLPELRKAILSSFFKDLDESVKIELKQRRLHSHWETEIPHTDPVSRRGDNLYLMTMEDPKSKICLFFDGRDLAIGIFAKNRDFPLANVLNEHLQDHPLESSGYWCWWFCPEARHKSFDSLISVHDDDELKAEKVVYFSNLLVGTAGAISKALED